MKNKKELNLKIPDIETLTNFLIEEGNRCLRPEVLYWLEGAERSEAICQKFSKPKISKEIEPREGLLDESKADMVAKDIYDLTFLAEKCPSGKEFGAYIECRGIAKALIDKYGFKSPNYD